MYYLERNREIARELSARKLKLHKLKAVGASRHTKFSPVGEVYCSVLQKDVYLGVKQPVSGDTNIYPYRHADELAIIANIAESLPQLLPELPDFYCLLSPDARSPVLGILTEDFSRNQTLSVSDAHFGDPLPVEINAAFPLWGIPEFELKRMCFFIAKKTRRLGDFYPLGYTFQSEVLPLSKVIYQHQKDYTVKATLT